MNKTSFPDNLSRAVAFEREGFAFYRKAMGMAENPMARSFFSQLMEDENVHSEYLIGLHEMLQARGEWPETITISMDKDFKLIFKEALENIDSHVAVSTGEIEALRFAVDMEYKGRDMYLELRDKANNPIESRLYAVLADWEQAHAEFLSDFYDYFENEGLFMAE